MRQQGPLKLLLALSVVLCATCAQAEDSDPLLKKRRTPASGAGAQASGKYVLELGQSALLSYEEIVEKPAKPIERKGGIVGKLDELGQEIDNVGSGKSNPKAEWSITVTPKLVVEPDQPAKVTLVVHEDRWGIDPQMKPESIALCEADRSSAAALLAAWEVTLNAKQMTDLERGKTIRLSVDKPFAGLKRLSRPTVSVRVGLKVGELRIRKVHFEYGLLEARKNRLRSEIAVLEESVTSRKDAVAKAKAEFDLKAAAVAEAKKLLAPLQAARDSALKKMKATGPDPSARSESYRAIEAKLTKARARADHAYSALLQLKEVSPNAGPDVSGKLIEDYEVAEAEAKKLQADLEATPEFKQFIADRQQLLKNGGEFETADNAYYEQVKATNHVRGDADLAKFRLERADVALAETQSELARVKESLAKAMLLEPPYAKEVSVQSTGSTGRFYHAKLWNPEPLLRVLELNIAALQPLPAQVRTQRAESSARCWEALKKCQQAQQEFSSAITRSRVAQAFVEFGSYLYDAWETGKTKGGMAAGILIETPKKLVEWAIFGIPSAAEGDSTSLESAEFWKKQFLTRSTKTLVTSPAASVAATAYLKNEAEKAFVAKYQEWIASRSIAIPGVGASELIADSAETAAALGAQIQAIQKSAALLTTAEQNLEKAVRSGLIVEGRTFKSIRESFVKWLIGEKPKVAPKGLGEWMLFEEGALKSALGKFLFGLAKDLAKAGLKQQIANTIETDAFMKYVEQDLIFDSCAAAHYDLGRLLHAVEENLAYFKSGRDEILSQYDPNNHTKIATNSPFKRTESLWIILNCDLDGAKVLADYEVEATLAGIKLERKSDAILQYLVPAALLAELDADAEGGVDLYFSIRAK